ncbi:maltose 6'-phosphate phosphatase [Enterococcus sp. AZ194]|uniref:endonuclease/exonuclease/phosphatase family protein n=1 Tax=Enterococcus sp. AZ194 TaxID=2774629 RepID=UPI003F24353E
MNLLTLNTHSWIEEKPLDKLEALAQVIHAKDVAVIALQEVNQRIDSAKVTLDETFHPTVKQVAIHEDNFAYLLVKRLKELGSNYHWCWMPSHIGYDIYEEGAAILSKTPLEAESLVVSETKEFTDYHTRCLIGATTELGGKTIYVMSSHFSWWIDQNSGFSYEWRNTKELLSKKRQPIFMLGDLNNPAHIIGEGYGQVLASQLPLTDSYLLAEEIVGDATVEKIIDGWENNNERLRIDYIFTSELFEVSNYEVIFDGKETPIVSDHFGILVSGKWKD